MNCRGIINTGGYTCFLNSTLQSLFSNEEFVKYMKLLSDEDIFSQYDQDLIDKINVNDSDEDEEDKIVSIAQKNKNSVSEFFKKSKKENIMWNFLRIVNQYTKQDFPQTELKSNLKKKTFNSKSTQQTKKFRKTKLRVIESDDEIDSDEDVEDKKDHPVDELSFSGFISRWNNSKKRNCSEAVARVEKFQVTDSDSEDSDNKSVENDKTSNIETTEDNSTLNKVSNIDTGTIDFDNIINNVLNEYKNELNESSENNDTKLENANSFRNRIKNIIDLTSGNDDEMDQDDEIKGNPSQFYLKEDESKSTMQIDESKIDNSGGHQIQDSDEDEEENDDNSRSDSPFDFKKFTIQKHISVKYFIDFMKTENSYLFSGEQQDAHEFIVYIINELDECILKKQKSLQKQLQELSTELSKNPRQASTLNLSPMLKDTGLKRAPNQSLDEQESFDNTATIIMSEDTNILEKIELLKHKLKILNFNNHFDLLATKQYFDKFNRNEAQDKQELQQQYDNWKNSLQLQKCSPLKKLFIGQLKSTIECLVCKKKSTTFDSFTDLNLEIPDNPKLHQLCNISLCYIDFPSGSTENYRKIRFETSKYTNIFKTLKKYRNEIYINDNDAQNTFENSSEYLLFYKSENDDDLKHLDCEETQCKDIPENSFLILYKKIIVSGESSDGFGYTKFSENIIRFNMFTSDNFEDDEKEKIEMPFFVSFSEEMTPNHFYSIVEAVFADFFEAYHSKFPEKEDESLDNYFKLFDSMSRFELSINNTDDPFQAYLTRTTVYSGSNVYSVDIHWQLNDFDKMMMFQKYIETRFTISDNIIGKRIQNRRILKMKIDDIFDNYRQPELLSGNNGWNCPNCNKKQNAVKRISVVQFPNNLILHLKRFRYNSSEEIEERIKQLYRHPNINNDLRLFTELQNLQNQLKEKVKAVVLYYENDLDTHLLIEQKNHHMSKQENQQKLEQGSIQIIEDYNRNANNHISNTSDTDKAFLDKFMFQSSINHKGQWTTSGHYTASCKRNNKIFLFDDTMVQQEDKFRPTYEAYMLFYKRNK